MQEEDPAIIEAQRFWEQRQHQRAVQTLLNRIRELNITVLALENRISVLSPSDIEVTKQQKPINKRTTAGFLLIATIFIIGLLTAGISAAAESHAFGLFYSPDDWWKESSERVSSFDFSVKMDEQYTSMGLTSSIESLREYQRQFDRIDAPKDALKAKAQIIRAMDETIDCYVQNQYQSSFSVSGCRSAKAAWSSAEVELDHLQLEHDDYSATYGY